MIELDAAVYPSGKYILSMNAVPNAQLMAAQCCDYMSMVMPNRRLNQKSPT